MTTQGHVPEFIVFKGVGIEDGQPVPHAKLLPRSRLQELDIHPVGAVVMKRARLSGLECFGRSPSRFARAKRLRRAFCASLLSMISSLWISTPSSKLRWARGLSPAKSLYLSWAPKRAFLFLAL